ncbi:serine/threonine-protein kinase [Leifsonia aquatica]|uniref:serine/threonine-protein kinase n=1 Tax=Leifsonia aquatica TaxID=144185 RepID=UPI000469803F|nr:serine/threonine-protein kinase [Leifsonia aquatica]
MTRRAIASPPVLPGYAVIRPLGSGGFADVFLYEQDLPRRVVAVKVLAAEAVNDETLRAFNAEADILARLSAHPAIVTVHLASISSDGRPFFVMEYCPDTMSARLRRDSLALTTVLETGVRIAGAVETVHRAGLLHRDIKPSNILITALGSSVLADFGIAAAGDEDGDVAMSVPWSAPEVLQETTNGTVASEVWSLAATVYTLLTGRSPFESDRRQANTRDLMTGRILKAVYTPTGRDDVPTRLEEALRTGLSKDPSRRFSSAQAFAEELRWVQYELGIPPTAIEVASPEWARAAGLIDLADSGRRGPVVSTVNPDSRRAQREAKQAAAAAEAKRDRDGLVVRERRWAGNPLVPALIGAGVAVVAVVGIGAALIVGGVL